MAVELKPDDLIFVRGWELNLIDDAIKIGEHILYKEPYAKCYVHAAVYIGNGLVAEAQGFRRAGTAPIKHYAGNYDVGRVEMDDDQRFKFTDALLQESGLPYDWIGIWWIIVKVLTGYDAKYKERLRRYCSKYIGWALKQAGITVNDYTPESLALDPKITLIKASPTSSPDS